MSIKYEIKAQQYMSDAYYLEVKEIDSKRILYGDNHVAPCYYHYVYDIAMLTHKRESTINKLVETNNGWISDGKIYFNTPEQILSFADNFITPHTIIRVLMNNSLK